MEGLPLQESFHYFISVVAAIFLEAAPFLLLGSLISGILEIYVEESLLARLVPRGRFGGVLFGLFAGLFLPTCECGIVPIVRRLLSKGVPASTAITYMLAAPVINPIVMLSTYVAFKGDLWMLGGRILFVVIPATVLGWLLGDITPGQLLRESAPQGCSHHCCHHSADAAPTQVSKLLSVFAHTAHEFMDMGKYLLFGAVVTALFKTYVPVGMVSYFQGNVALSVLFMMLLAIFLSVCSEADAFVAVSFSAFPKVAQLAFIGIGPMVDLKLIAMFGAVFKRRVVLDLILVPTLIVYGLALLLSSVIG
jgi:uncharacterized protein